VKVMVNIDQIQNTVPAPRLRRFEKVIVTTTPPDRCQFVGQCGTVLWATPPQRQCRPYEWAYSVYLPGMDHCINAGESSLQSTGEFDPPEAHLGTRFELSHDLLPDEHGEFFYVEGTYRLPGRFWQVMVFAKSDVPALRHWPQTWESGITGIAFQVPKGHRLDKAYVERPMSEAFSAEQWVEVMGPDSIILR
jgi:hypothetical protein